MTDMRELLERVSLRAVGMFLMGEERLLERLAEREVPAETLMTEKYDDLRISLHKARVLEHEEVVSTVREIEAVAESAGFYAGLKAGARLMLALTDGREIVC